MKNYRIEVLYLLNGVRITDPFGRSRDRVNVLRPDKDRSLPVEFLEHGIVVGETEFVPYGSFYAAMCKVEAEKGGAEEILDTLGAVYAPAKAPEAVQESPKPAPATKPRRRTKRAAKKD